MAAGWHGSESSQALPVGCEQEESAYDFITSTNSSKNVFTIWLSNFQEFFLGNDCKIPGIINGYLK